MRFLSRLFLALPLTVAAVELPVPQNVTGPYELRIQSEEPDAFADGGGIEFWNRETGKLVGKAGISYGGYGTAKTAAESMPVLWHGSGNYVAFTTRATKHTRELAVYSLENNEPRRLEYADFVQNALGQIGATSIDLQCVVTPLEWSGDDLHLRLSFSTSMPARGRLFYETRVVLHLEHGPNAAPTLRLQSVEPPHQWER